MTLSVLHEIQALRQQHARYITTAALDRIKEGLTVNFIKREVKAKQFAALPDACRTILRRVRCWRCCSATVRRPHGIFRLRWWTCAKTTVSMCICTAEVATRSSYTAYAAPLTHYSFSP